MMNEHDMNNLSFMLSLDTDSLEHWYNNVDDDDHLYAYEILEKAKEYLLEQKLNNTEWSESKNIIHTIMTKNE